MAKKYVYMWAIIIDGNFITGKIYYKTFEEAVSNLEFEAMEGFKKLEKEYPYYEHYCELNPANLTRCHACVGTYLRDADEYEKFITYKVSKVRVPV